MPNFALNTDQFKTAQLSTSMQNVNIDGKRQVKNGKYLPLKY